MLKLSHMLSDKAAFSLFSSQIIRRTFQPHKLTFFSPLPHHKPNLTPLLPTPRNDRIITLYTTLQDVLTCKFYRGSFNIFVGVNITKLWTNIIVWYVKRVKLILRMFYIILLWSNIFETGNIVDVSYYIIMIQHNYMILRESGDLFF